MCDKKCPYCIAKITKWPIRQDCLEKLEEKLLFLKTKNIRFKYFVISGNGDQAMENHP